MADERPYGPETIEAAFVFVPHGDPPPMDWMARHPDWVKIPATFVPHEAVSRGIAAGEAWLADRDPAMDWLGMPASVGAPVYERRPGRMMRGGIPPDRPGDLGEDPVAAYLRTKADMDRLAADNSDWTDPIATLLKQAGSLASLLDPIGTAQAQEPDPDAENRGLLGDLLDPLAEVRTETYNNAMTTLREIDPNNPELSTLTGPNYVPSAAVIDRAKEAIKAASTQRARDLLLPDGRFIGTPETGNKTVRNVLGGDQAAQTLYDQLAIGGTPIAPPNYEGVAVIRPDGGFVGIRLGSAAKSGVTAVDVNIPGIKIGKVHFPP